MILSATSPINCIIAPWPDKHCLSHGMCLYQVMLTLHFLNDVANENESFTRIQIGCENIIMDSHPN